MQETTNAVARLVEYSRGKFVALPPHTTLEVIEQPRLATVPGAAYYTRGLLAWQGKYIPVVDLETLLRAYPQPHAAAAPRYALVVAYQTAPGAPVEHGAIALNELPDTATVDDAAACDLPKDSDLWDAIALSCFSIEGKAVPIVDTGALFGRFHG